MPDPSPPVPESVSDLPVVMASEAELDEVLVRPSAALVSAIRGLRSPLVVLGAGGKMGPTLAVLARRAAAAAGHPLDVVAVSRFRSSGARDWLEARGVRTLAVDLFDRREVEGLPDTDNLAYLVGLKFGTTEDPSSTWAVNTVVPARVCERYPGARMVVLSTGNVYPFVPVEGGGSRETEPMTPLGEYANAAVARERVFEWYSRTQGTRVAAMRLSYAVDLRYGVLVDIGRRILAGEPMALVNGHFNCIWQGDANDAILRAFELARSPLEAWNLCRPEAIPLRAVAEELGRRLGRAPRFTGVESGTGLLSDTRKLVSMLGEPSVSVDRLLGWVAGWLAGGGRSLDRPTHFEERNGRY